MNIGSLIVLFSQMIYIIVPTSTDQTNIKLF